MEIGCSTVLFRKYSLDNALRWIRDLGVDYIETQAVGDWCPHVDIRQDDPITFAARVREHGFRGVTALWMPDGAFLANPCSVESGKLAVQWAAAAGIPVVNMGDGPKPASLTDADALVLLRERFAEVLEVAGHCKVYLALEPHGAFSLSPGGLQRLTGLVDSPWLGINFDTANVHHSGMDEVSVLNANRDRIVHVHAKDTDAERTCVALGTGVVAIRPCLEALIKTAYGGVVSLESEGEQDHEEMIRMARHSLNFLRSAIHGMEQI